MTNLVEVRKGGSKRAGHLPRVNASNHLRRAVSSLAREKTGLGSDITARCRLQCLIGVLVECGAAGSMWEVVRVNAGATCSRSRNELLDAWKRPQLYSKRVKVIGILAGNCPIAQRLFPSSMAMTQ
jgi:hypothetical protein